MSKVAVVTGASSGIGRCTAASLAAAGCKVYDLSRRDVPAEGVIHIGTDVTNAEQVNSAVKRITETEGRIDILVSNAGFGISGAAEFTDSGDAHAQMEVNLFGMDNAIKAVLPVMRSQGSGRIVCISSVAGILPIPFQLWYSVSKSAVIAYALALQNEVRPFGVTVCTILPGDIASGFTDVREKSQLGDDIYEGRIERSVAGMEHDERTGMSCETAGNCIARFALKEKSRAMVAIGIQYKAAAVLAKLLPRTLSDWVVGLLYAK